ncbi:hypothetical protein C8J57DRAFT_1526413 [Mycena rebaudengoi]|nr:hypothetical protein C8J57DRAFT_1526413 [Mycena rebaudengoi]
MEAVALKMATESSAQAAAYTYEALKKQTGRAKYEKGRINLHDAFEVLRDERAGGLLPAQERLKLLNAHAQLVANREDVDEITNTFYGSLAHRGTAKEFKSKAKQFLKNVQLIRHLGLLKPIPPHASTFGLVCSRFREMISMPPQIQSVMLRTLLLPHMPPKRGIRKLGHIVTTSHLLPFPPTSHLTTIPVLSLRAGVRSMATNTHLRLAAPIVQVRNLRRDRRDLHHLIWFIRAPITIMTPRTHRSPITIALIIPVIV